MSTVLKLPSPEDVGSFFANLLGPPIESEGCPAEGFTCYAFAEYVNDEGEVNGIVACDLESAARLSASLTRIPKGVIDDSVRSGIVPDHILENLEEIFNISSNLFPDSHRHRISLKKSYLEGEAAEQFAALDSSILSAFELEIMNYGPGKICMASCAASSENSSADD